MNFEQGMPAFINSDAYNYGWSITSNVPMNGDSSLESDDIGNSETAGFDLFID